MQAFSLVCLFLVPRNTNLSVPDLFHLRWFSSGRSRRRWRRRRGGSRWSVRRLSSGAWRLCWRCSTFWTSLARRPWGRSWGRWNEGPTDLCSPKPSSRDSTTSTSWSALRGTPILGQTHFHYKVQNAEFKSALDGRYWGKWFSKPELDKMCIKAADCQTSSPGWLTVVSVPFPLPGWLISLRKRLCICGSWWKEETKLWQEPHVSPQKCIDWVHC